MDVIRSREESRECVTDVTWTVILDDGWAEENTENAVLTSRGLHLRHRAGTVRTFVFDDGWAEESTENALLTSRGHTFTSSTFTSSCWHCQNLRLG